MFDMNFNFFCMSNSSFIRRDDHLMKTAIFSCKIEYIGCDKKKHSSLYANNNFFDLIRDIRSHLYPDELLGHKKEIVIHCQSQFWRDNYNSLNDIYHKWIKKDIIISPRTFKIKSVITYGLDKVTVEKYSLKEGVHAISEKEYKWPEYEKLDIKYLDKFRRTENAIYVIDDGRCFGTLEEAIYYAEPNKYDSDEAFVSIEIYDYTVSDNPRLDKEKEYTIEEIKEETSTHCNFRMLVLDRKKTKILYEACYNEWYDYKVKFDYGVLYGKIILDPYRKYKSISGYTLGSDALIIECLYYGNSYNEDAIKRILEGDDKFKLADGINFLVGYFGYDADEDYYNAYDSAPGIIPAEDLVPAYNYDEYNQVKVHVGVDWEESDKFKGETNEHPFYYKQEFFVKELVGVNDFLSFVKLTDKFVSEETTALFETKYAYIKLFNDNGNVTIYMDRVRGIYLDFDKGGDLVFMIPKKKEEA